MPVAEVLYFKAELKYITVRTAARSYILDGSLSDLEERHAGQFLRVHRNALVSRRAVRALEKHFDAEEGEGWAVRLNGVPVGSVKDVELADRGVRVRLAINANYIPRLPRGAQARLTREGYVGAAAIQILPGTSATDRTPVAEGDEIRFVAQKGLTDMLDEVRQQMTPALQELRRAASEMADPSSRSGSSPSVIASPRRDNPAMSARERFCSLKSRRSRYEMPVWKPVRACRSLSETTRSGSA